MTNIWNSLLGGHLEAVEPFEKLSDSERLIHWQALAEKPLVTTRSLIHVLEALQKDSDLLPLANRWAEIIFSGLFFHSSLIERDAAVDKYDFGKHEDIALDLLARLEEQDPPYKEGRITKEEISRILDRLRRS